MALLKENIKGIPLAAFRQKMVDLGHSSFRADQLFQWIYQKKESDFSLMTNLSKDFRQFLDDRFVISKLEAAEAQYSDDGTVKFLVRLHDNETVEAVFIPTEDRNTLCISTQVGCKMACTFCATGYQKFTRDLKAWEMVDQVMSLPFPGPIRNVVLMGMGEPFDNYDEVIKALEIMQHPLGIQIGKRHITVSTVGLSPKITEFVNANLGKLAVSLHGTTEEQRSKIMPINKKYSIQNLMQTCRELTFKGKLRVTFEYILIKDLNDSNEDAYRLADLVKDIPCKINLLAYNENPYIAFKRPDESRVLTFQKILLGKNLTTTYRRSRGRDIAAACGQLRTEDKIKASALLRMPQVAVAPQLAL